MGHPQSDNHAVKRALVEPSSINEELLSTSLGSEEEIVFIRIASDYALERVSESETALLVR